MRSQRLFVTAAAAVLALMLSAGGASASTTVDPGSDGGELSGPELVQLREFFDDYGVSEATQEALILSLESGEVWQSLAPGAKPVTEKSSIQGGIQTTVATYADGSIAVSRVSAPQKHVAPPGEVVPLSVYGCSTSGSSGYAWYYTNCVADVNLGIIRMYFNFDWENVRGFTPKITRYWNYQYHIIGGALSNHRFVRMSSYDVRYAADLSVAWEGFPLGWTAYMGVRVNTGTAVTYNN